MTDLERRHAEPTIAASAPTSSRAYQPLRVCRPAVLTTNIELVLVCMYEEPGQATRAILGLELSRYASNRAGRG